MSARLENGKTVWSYECPCCGEEIDVDGEKDYTCHRCKAVLAINFDGEPGKDISYFTVDEEGDICEETGRRLDDCFCDKHSWLMKEIEAERKADAKREEG
jgi:hypothetical protein